MSPFKIKSIFGALAMVAYMGYKYNQPAELTPEQVQMQSQMAAWSEAHKKSVQAELCKGPESKNLPECNPEAVVLKKPKVAKTIAPSPTPVPKALPPPPPEPIQEVVEVEVPAPETLPQTESGLSLYLNMGTHTIRLVMDPNLSPEDMQLLKQKLKGMCLSDPEGGNCQKPIFSDTADLNAYVETLRSAKQKEWVTAGLHLVCDPDSENPLSGDLMFQRANSITEAKRLLGFEAKILLHRQPVSRDPASQSSVKGVYEVRSN